MVNPLEKATIGVIMSSGKSTYTHFLRDEASWTVASSPVVREELEASKILAAVLADERLMHFARDSLVKHLPPGSLNTSQSHTPSLEKKSLQTIR